LIQLSLSGLGVVKRTVTTVVMSSAVRLSPRLRNGRRLSRSSYLDTNTPAHPIEISNVIVAVQLVVWTHVEKAMQCGKNLGYRQRREIVKLTSLSGPARALLSLPRVS